MLVSCAPVNNISDMIENEPAQNNNIYNELENNKTLVLDNKNLEEDKPEPKIDVSVKSNIKIILSKKDNSEIVNQFINVLELAVYQKSLKNISFEIILYSDSEELKKILNNSSLPGSVFVGPLNSKDTQLLENYCDSGAIFFSFSSDKSFAKDCVYLVNFFPENELRTVFNYFPENSKIALLFPENEYGFGINKIIDEIVEKSNSVIVNRASYNPNLSNAPQAIKELGKYELRKYELNRQKKLLATKQDEKSKKRLLRLEKFQTTQDFDFTHVLIADYGLRLLQVAPLLPYYDIDPNKVQFVGTGAWDDEVFYDEPSLSGSIYPGIDYINRKQLIEDYNNLYNEQLLRISTLPFDIVGLLDFIIKNNFSLLEFHNLLNEKSAKFLGVDGNFYFLENAIERELSILKIEDGKALVISK